jgi:hypothetical protein
VIVGIPPETVRHTVSYGIPCARETTAGEEEGQLRPALTWGWLAVRIGHDFLVECTDRLGYRALRRSPRSGRNSWIPIQTKPCALRITTYRASLATPAISWLDWHRRFKPCPVGAVTLALFAALATLPAYQDPLPTIFLAFGLVPFALLVAASALEFGRSEQKGINLPLHEAEDTLAAGDWLAVQIGARRLDIGVLEATIVRKRNRLRLVSGLLAVQVGYLLIVTIVVALLEAAK